MTDKEKSLAIYRFTEAKETFLSASLCFENKLYKDSINWPYYVVFYTIKAILALDSMLHRLKKQENRLKQLNILF